MTVPESDLPITEQDPETPQDGQPVVKKKKKTNWQSQRNIPFHATITLFTPVKPLHEQPERAEIVLAGEAQTVEVVGYACDQIQDVPTDQLMATRLWFRTSQGHVQQLQLTHIRPMNEGEGSVERPTFSIAGRIQEINTDEGYVVIGIEPNKGGILENTFAVEVWATLDQLEGRHIKIGRTVWANGQYRPGSARLVAKRIAAVHLGERLAKPAAAPSAEQASEASEVNSDPM